MKRRDFMKYGGTGRASWCRNRYVETPFLYGESSDDLKWLPKEQLQA